MPHWDLDILCNTMLLLYQEGKSVEEISRELGVPEKTAEKRLINEGVLRPLRKHSSTRRRVKARIRRL